MRTLRFYWYFFKAQCEGSRISASHVSPSLQLPFVFLLLTDRQKHFGGLPNGYFWLNFARSIGIVGGFWQASEVGLCSVLLLSLLKGRDLLRINTDVGADTTTPRTDKLKHKLTDKRKHNRLKRNNASISSSFSILLKPTVPMMTHLMGPLHLMLSSQSRSNIA